MAAEPWQEKIARLSFIRYLKAQREIDRQLAIALREAAREAERLVASIIPNGTSEQIRRAMFAQRSEALWRSQAKLWREVSAITEEGIARSTELAIAANQDIARYLAEKGAPEELVEAFAFSARQGAEAVRSRLMMDIELSPRVYQNQALSRRKIQTAVNNGLALGKSAAEIAKDVKAFIRPDTPGGASYAAKRLGRTEINNAFHTTTVRAAHEQPWVQAFQWNLSGSHSRPDVCNEYAEDDHDDLGPGVFEKGNVPPKPHPQCLCYVTAVTVDIDTFLTELKAGSYDTYLTHVGIGPVGVS